MRISDTAIGSHEKTNGGETNDWLTPQWVLDTLGPFDLDPCASEFFPSRVAPVYYTWRENGLAQDWGGAFVFLNPPYSNHVGKWLTRLADHGNGIALVFARTETKAFNANLSRATSILFPEGRLSFIRATDGRSTGNAGAPSLFAAYGEVAAERLHDSSIHGFIMRPDPSVRKFGKSELLAFDERSA
jgi:hypothetical protein